MTGRRRVFFLPVRLFLLPCCLVCKFRKYIAGAEIIIMLLIIRHLFGTELRMSLFLTFFYEITVALWEFMLSASLGILFRSEGFLEKNTLKYMAAVWIVRALMLGIVFLNIRIDHRAGYPLFVKAREGINRVISAVAVAGLFGVIFLSGQSIITTSRRCTVIWKKTGQRRQSGIWKICVHRLKQLPSLYG